MFSNITWTQYFLALALATGAYYAIVILLYFRQGVYTLVRTTNLLPQRYNGTDQDERPDYDGLAKVVVDLKSILESAGGVEKGAVLSQLKQRLVTYPGLRLPAFRIAVFQFIIRNSAQACGFTVSEKELEAMIPLPFPTGTN